jgi:UDP-N-acetylmuramate--alanine ligase
VPADAPAGVAGSPPGSPVDLSTPRRIHVVGAGGSGMSAIATVLAAMGHQVSGSDLRPSPALERLAAHGVTVHAGHDAAHTAGAEVLAISTAVKADNVEVRAALAAGVPVESRARILAAIAAQRSVLAVAGTHGKTTTSAMLAAILVTAGWHPSWIVGGDIIGLGGAAWDEAGERMVVEADESDGTFLALPRQAGIVTSVEPDHLDFWGDEAAMVRAYEDFLAGCAEARVVCADDPGAARLGRRLAGAGQPVVSYGTTAGADWHMADVQEDRLGSTFTLHAPDGAEGRVALHVPGLHNARNAAGAVALAVAAGVPFPAALDGISRFAGVARRLERRGERGGVTFVDDYAHLPGEVATVIATAARAGWARVVAVFQPHRYTRTRALHAAFADSFAGADVLVVTGLYTAGEAPIPGVTGRLVHDAVARAHPDQELHYVESLADLPDALDRILRAGDLCLTLGAGDLTEVPARMVDRP